MARRSPGRASGHVSTRGGGPIWGIGAQKGRGGFPHTGLGGGGTGQWPDVAIRARTAAEDVHMGEGVVMKIENGYIIGDGLNKEIY